MSNKINPGVSVATEQTFAAFFETDVTYEYDGRMITVAVRDLLGGTGETDYFTDAMERMVDDAMFDDDPEFLLEIVEWTLLDVIDGVKRARSEFEAFKARHAAAHVDGEAA